MTHPAHQLKACAALTPPLPARINSDETASRPAASDGGAESHFDLSDVPADFKQRVEDACNEAVRLSRQIDVRVLPRE